MWYEGSRSEKWLSVPSILPPLIIFLANKYVTRGLIQAFKGVIVRFGEKGIVEGALFAIACHDLLFVKEYFPRVLTSRINSHLRFLE